MLVIFIKVKFILGIVLECDFEMRENRYACIAQNLETSENNRTITDVKGPHLGAKTHEDVVSLHIEGGKGQFLPLNISGTFKNLECLHVSKPDVVVTYTDLKDLEKLKNFVLSNKINSDFYQTIVLFLKEHSLMIIVLLTLDLLGLLVLNIYQIRHS